MGGTLLNVQLDIGMSPLGVSPVSDPGACRCPLRNAREQPISIFMGFGKEWRKREGIAMSARGPRRSLLEARPAARPRGSNSLAAPPPSRSRATPRAPAVRAAYFFSASFRRRFPAFFFLCLRRRISRFRSVVIFCSVGFPREYRAELITKAREER